MVIGGINIAVSVDLKRNSFTRDFLSSIAFATCIRTLLCKLETSVWANVMARNKSELTKRDRDRFLMRGLECLIRRQSQCG